MSFYSKFSSMEKLIIRSLAAPVIRLAVEWKIFELIRHKLQLSNVIFLKRANIKKNNLLQNKLRLWCF